MGPKDNTANRRPILRRIARILWRRKSMIFSIVLITTLLAWTIAYFLPLQYTARAVILVEETDDAAYSLLTGLQQSEDITGAETERLKSRQLAARVLGLLQNAAARPGEPSPRFRSFNLQSEGLEQIEGEYSQPAVSQTLDALIKNLNVRTQPDKQTVIIEFTAGNPQEAADIANIYAHAYLEQRQRNRMEIGTRVEKLFDIAIRTLREQIRQSEEILYAHRARTTLQKETTPLFGLKQKYLSSLYVQLALAEANLAGTQAKLVQLNKGTARSDPAVLDSPLIQALKKEESRLIRKLAGLSTRYGEKHPRMLDAYAELEEIRTSIRKETGKIVKSLRQEAIAGQNKVDSLKSLIGIPDTQETTEETEDTQTTETLDALEQEIKVDRRILLRFLETYKLLDRAKLMRGPGAEIISPAAAPSKPSSPGRHRIVLFAAALSLCFSFLLVSVRETMDNTLRTEMQIEQETGYPCHGMIPAIEGLSKMDLADYILSKPSSSLAESIRSLRTALRLRNGESSPKVITVTSSFPGEGKTTLAGWMGRLAAKSGEKIILIDCDLRRPNVHKVFGKKNEKSLVDYLTDRAKLEDVVLQDDPSGMHMILAQSAPNSAYDLISSAKMEKLIASLRQVYDLVILDSPACLAVSEPRLLATLSDATLYAVFWNKTPRENVREGARQFAGFDYKNLSFVLTNVDVRRHAQYGYGDTAYYYGKYEEDTDS